MLKTCDRGAPAPYLLAMEREQQEVERLRQQRAELLAEAELLAYPWQRHRRRRLRRRADELHKEVIARLERLSASERVADSLSLFCADLRADGRLDELDVRPDPAPGDPHRYLFSHRGCEPSVVSLPPRPAEELRQRRRVRSTLGRVEIEPGPKQITVDGERCDWDTAVRWVRADLLAASYSFGDPHPGYLRQREEIEQQRRGGAPPSTPPEPPLWRSILRAPLELLDGLAWAYLGSEGSPLIIASTWLVAAGLLLFGHVAPALALFALPALLFAGTALAALIDWAFVRPYRLRRGQRIWWPLDSDGYLRLHDSHGRLHVLSGLDRELILEGELLPDGRRCQTLLPHDAKVVDACLDQRPADIYVPAIEAAFPWTEGEDSPRQRAERKRLIAALGS